MKQSTEPGNAFDAKGIPLLFYNTASREKERFVPAIGEHVRMYTCGPTVYHYAHIGNFRTYVFEDILRRTLKFFGFGITQAMNLTDVDDKTIRGAIAADITLDEYTEPFKKAFFEDLQALNIEPAEYYPAATDYIAEMIAMIECLVDKGVAYRGEDASIYFAIEQFPGYGCLSRLCLEELEAGRSNRTANDEYQKENISDFVLWKSYEEERDGNIFWDSPFGKGRPGWHLECSAMAIKILGETIDIHVGGVDNIFPHHENEIAQSEACTGRPFARFWMHSEHLLVDQKKMSKSLGNFYTLRDLLNRGYTGIQVRYMLMQGHYRTPMNFTFPGLEAAKNSLRRLDDFIARLQSIEIETIGGEIRAVQERTFQAFSEALADDLNVSSALAALFDFVRTVNGLCDADRVSREEAKQTLEFLMKLNTVLGILSFEKAEPEIPLELQEALEKRLRARSEKNWKLADELRDFISAKGYMIEDSPAGARLKKI